MEPIIVGAIALVTLIGSKAVEWTTGKTLDAGLDKVKQVIKAKSPETAAALEAAAAQKAITTITALHKIVMFLNAEGRRVKRIPPKAEPAG